jgi:hypothetical protein
MRHGEFRKAAPTDYMQKASNGYLAVVISPKSQKREKNEKKMQEYIKDLSRVEPKVSRHRLRFLSYVVFNC